MQRTRRKWDRKNLEGVELTTRRSASSAWVRIGSELSRRAIVFGMRVIAYDPVSLRDTRAKFAGRTCR